MASYAMESGTSSCSIARFDVAAQTGIRLHPAHTPCRWREHQFSTESWLDEELRATTTTTTGEADLIFLANHNFALWCHRSMAVKADLLRSSSLTARLRGRACQEGQPPTSLAAADSSLPLLRGNRTRQPLTPERLMPCQPRFKEELWRRLMAHPTLVEARRRSVPVVLTATNNECAPPWTGRGQALPPGVLLLMTQDRTRRPYDAVVPLALAAPPWLVGEPGAAPPSPPLPWAERRLLFFAGHVPKLYISATRYKLWKQLYNASAVTVVSSTIGCTVGAYAVCQSESRIAAEHRTFCHAACGARAKAVCAASAADLRKRCKIYNRRVDWRREEAAIARTARSLPHAEYLALAAAHRFMLVVPGDMLSTRKIAEAMALGGASGVVPLFVVPSALRGQMVLMLPFTRWLDWCSVAYFILEKDAASSRMRSLLGQLAALPSHEVRAKQAALRRVWPAFVLRPRRNESDATGADYLRGEACAAARRFRTSAPPTPARRDLGACTLTPPLAL